MLGFSDFGPELYRGGLHKICKYDVILSVAWCLTPSLARSLARSLLSHPSPCEHQARPSPALECSYPDEPGLLARLTGAIGAAGGNILEVIHNRLDLGRLARETSIRLIVETRDDGHTRRVITAIEKVGLAVRLDEHIGGQY